MIPGTIHTWSVRTLINTNLTQSDINGTPDEITFHVSSLK